MPSPDLPDYAKQSWSEPDPSTTTPPRLAPKPGPDPLTTRITETHAGVQNLQVLLQQPEDPSKIDVAIDLLQTISGQMKGLSDGLDLLFYRQNELFRAMGKTIPARPRQD